MVDRQLQVGAIKSMFDEIIDRHAEAYIAAFPDQVKEFSNFEKSGSSNYYIGMVWTNDYEKPDVQQIRIRGSLALSNNRIVELNLGNITTQQSFFPGQIVAFLAEPFIKRQLTVKKFLDPMMIAPPMKKIDITDEINLLIASGPFMKPEQTDWLLFDKLIENIKSNNATHVILIGPLVDLENKAFRIQYDSNWRQILDKLVEGLHEHHCQVFIVQSNRDVLPCSMSSNYFYPCSKIDIKLNLKAGVQPKCSIISVTDPSQIDLGGIYVDVTSAEVIFHLNNCISFINKEQGNVFTAIYKHILAQGIYPIYPPPLDIAIDYPKLQKSIQIDRLAPHILVLPTRFNTSIEKVENRLAVAIHKCSVRKQVVLIKIPKIDTGFVSEVASYSQVSI